MCLLPVDPEVERCHSDAQRITVRLRVLQVLTDNLAKTFPATAYVGLVVNKELQRIDTAKDELEVDVARELNGLL